MNRCDAHADGYPSAHTCADPATCALESMVEGSDDRDEQLARLHELLDRLEEACGASRAKVAQALLAMVHAERGGPR